MESGTKLLHYELVEKIGEGGMGVVWRARDTSLDREVAIKLLPELFSRDPERLVRFEREAKLLASLNHPNIATIHGLHQAPAGPREGEVRFLAMEMIEGEDLATRLTRGPLAPDEVVMVGAQVAAALEAAHSQGVIHRDLKPANIALTPDGKAKVLDFGLAKATEPDAASASGNLSLSPTLTTRGTEAGMILGTAAYMSPEQARGRPVDRRTDLWSLGCVLYECLTGVQLFRGETVSDSLAAILRKDPDWSLLPAGTPPLVGMLVRRCLTRDPARRLQDAGDARVELETALEDPRGASLGLGAGEAGTGPASRGRAWIPWAVAALAVVAAAFFALQRRPPPTETAGSFRLSIPLPAPVEFGSLRAAPPVLSPDGRYVVFGVPDDGGEAHLWIRNLHEFGARRLAQTRGAAYPFWSPDSRHIGFFDSGKIRRIEIATGRIQTVGGGSSAFPRGASWNSDGLIAFVPNSNTGVHVIGEAGGEQRQITIPDPDVPDASHRWPWFLPDGEHLLFVFWTNDVQAREEHGGIYVASLSGDSEPVKLVPDTSSVAYVDPGYLLVVRDRNLIATPFDAKARRITGEGKVIASDVLHNRGNAHAVFSASLEGTLVYTGGEAFPPAVLSWYDRSGTRTRLSGEPAPFRSLRLSPSSDQAATSIPGNSGDGQVWTVDLMRGVRTSLGSGDWENDYPIWSGDGQRILYTSQEGGTLNFWVRPADGSGDPVPFFSDHQDKVLYDWSRDGRHVAYWPMGSRGGTPDLWIYTADTDTAEPLITGDVTYTDARFSPDGRWIAYVSDESGRLEVFAQELRMDGGVKAGARGQVSTSGGSSPLWRDDGREIVYIDPQRRVMAVQVNVHDGKMVLGTPEELFRIDSTIVTLDATGDHQRFLVGTRESVAQEPLRIVLNWPADL